MGSNPYTPPSALPVASQLWHHLPNHSPLRRFLLLWSVKTMAPRRWIQPLLIFTMEKYNSLFMIWTFMCSNKQKSSHSVPVVPDTTSKCKQPSCCDVIDTELLAFATSYAIYIDASVTIIQIIINSSHIRYGYRQCWELIYTTKYFI